MKSRLIMTAACTLAAAALAACAAEDQRTREAPMDNSTATAVRSVTSKDGTRIAFDKQGSGPALILVGGALSDRSGSEPFAKLLADRFTVYSFDRRGRGDSGDTKPYAVQREIEDIEALIDEAGGSAHVAGFSSGAALALEAAAALGGKVRKLAIYEPPYDEAEGAADKWKRYRAEQAELLAAGRRAEAVEHHLKFVGVPQPALAQMKSSPMWQGMTAMAPTLPNDVAVIGDDRKVPVERAARVNAPALVMDGGANRETMPFMRATANRIAGAIPNAQRRTIEGQGHNVSPEALAPVLVEFLSGN
ncbi:MAG TPA: alpha/beta hydrolase [Sphingomicrobium sp.]